MKSLAVFLLVVLLPSSLAAQVTQTGFLDRVLSEGGTSRHYQVFVPPSYDPNVPWPAILFLHGGGEEGTDGYRPTNGGLGEAIRLNVERFPGIVVFPQVRPNHRWTGPEADFALRALDDVQREFAVDPDRIYLTGLSRGGLGTYYIAYRHAPRFSAILAVCGRVLPTSDVRRSGALWLENSPVVPAEDGDPFSALAERLKETPTWIFHGDADPQVPVEESRRLFAELQKRGAPARYSELPGVGHNSWDDAYQSSEVIQWLFSHSRRAR